MQQSYAKRVEGVFVMTMPYGEVVTHQSFTCGHCQALVKIPPGLGGQPDGTALCKTCMGLVCKRCNAAAASGKKCAPWEKRMVAIEARDIALRSYGL